MFLAVVRMLVKLVLSDVIVLEASDVLFSQTLHGKDKMSKNNMMLTYIGTHAAHEL